MNVSFQGIPGAHSELALLDFARKNALDLTPMPEAGYFRELFAGIKKNGFGWVPIENSYHGTVVESVDLLEEYDVHIVASYEHAVEHCLAGTVEASLDTVTEAHSHPQALGQCMKYLSEHGMMPVKHVDTAAAAQDIANMQDKTKAAICSKRAAELYGLKILASGIQDAEQNTTTFLLVSEKPEQKIYTDTDTITTIIFKTKDIPSALYKCLGGFATNGVNLTKIESRPARDGESSYFFYIDIQGSQDDPEVIRALDELRHFSRSVKILGTY